LSFSDRRTVQASNFVSQLNGIEAVKPGDVVVILGCCGKLAEVFLAGKNTGPTGRVIGVDGMPDALAKARLDTVSYRQTVGLDNVEFRLGEIERLPLADASADLVIVSDAIDRSDDKPQVWREMARILKPGGRVAVSALALIQPLSPAILDMPNAQTRGIAGLPLVAATERMAKEAGFEDVALVAKTFNADSRDAEQKTMLQAIAANLPLADTLSESITSLEITARKPEASCGASVTSRYTPAVAELVAIGASVASNCEFCLTYHYEQGRRLGLTREEMSAAVATAKSIKDAPARAILKLAGRHLDKNF
jgi:AhpD family alkylhydroperoxidase